MLQALTKHKISHEFRNQIWNLEDAKTSSIIGNLLHLPTDLFWEIMLCATASTDKHSHSLPKVGETGEILDYEFWPSWRLIEKVEPDVFISFENFDLIIELKVNDYNQQKSWQWKREFDAYRQQYPNETKNVYLIAISGKTEETLENVFQCSWQSILESVVNTRQNYKNNQATDNLVRVLDDIITAFSFHKEYAFKYLDSVMLKELPIQTNCIIPDLPL